jgi:hypothetical protein
VPTQTAFRIDQCEAPDGSFLEASDPIGTSAFVVVVVLLVLGGRLESGR